MNQCNYEVLDKYIYKLARSFTSDYSLIEDLYQQGMIGVLKAEKKYDKNSNVDFIYFAKMYIYGEMYGYFNGAYKTFKTNKNILKQYKNIKNAKDILTQELKRLPSLSDLSNFTSIKEEEITYILELMQTTLSINYEYDERSMEDLISYKDSYESIEINDLIKDLTYEEKKVFMYKYIEGYNQSEIAKMMHTSQSSVSRFENSGIKKVRKKTY